MMHLQVQALKDSRCKAIAADETDSSMADFVWRSSTANAGRPLDILAVDYGLGTVKGIFAHERLWKNCHLS